jgi:hypothetical protein
MRGSALNALFGVKGIQKASSELGRSVWVMIRLLGWLDALGKRVAGEAREV